MRKREEREWIEINKEELVKTEREGGKKGEREGEEREEYRLRMMKKREKRQRRFA